LSDKLKYIIISSLILIFAAAVFNTAWVTEDAYITFRTIDNFINGYGLTWNITERVQTYTHPLWMFLLSSIYFFSHEIYYSSIILSFLLSILAISLFSFRISQSFAATVAGITVLCFSKGFIEYSTSGLENPLSHFLTALFLTYFFSGTRREPNIRYLLILSLIAGMGTLNRMDTILIFFPVLIFYLIQIRNPKAGLLAITAGFLPFAIWELFSLFYYGSLFPNTAYAKLNTGIGGSLMAKQGMYYLVNSIKLDPVLLPVILTGILMPVIKKDKPHITLSASIILYLIYIIKIGGDFMSGRFLTIPLFLSVAVISQYAFNTKKWIIMIVVILFAALFSSQLPILSGPGYGKYRGGIVSAHGISDERRAYYPNVGMLKSFGKDEWPDHRWAATGKKANTVAKKLITGDDSKTVSLYQTGTTVGLYGYFAGPHVHIIDELSLCDPLLSRLPLSGSKWRPGHFRRHIPDGYIETLVLNEDLIQNKSLGKFYDKLKYVITGPLFDLNRIIEIWNINTGKYNHFIKPDINQSVSRFKNKQNNIIAERLLESINENHENPIRYVNLYYQFGQLYRKEGSTNQAEKQYITALAINPFYMPAQNRLAEIYADTGQTGKAISVFKKLKKLSGNMPEIDYNIACMYAQQNDIETSITWLKKAIKGGFNKWDVIETDRDLDNIRETEEYKAIISGR